LYLAALFVFPAFELGTKAGKTSYKKYKLMRKKTKVSGIEKPLFQGFSFFIYH
jgi:hypothetical protein